MAAYANSRVNTASLFESVPNFSEGRDREVIDAIAAATVTAHLLDVDADPDHNRVVVSLAAHRKGLLGALTASAAVAVDRIDLRRHQGAHPRVGAADVIPIVPLGATSLTSCHELARDLGERIWTELKVPIYFYGHGERHTLADIRAGRARPDLGGPSPHPTAGAACIGARSMLVAFNVLLPETDFVAARALARSLRESAGGMRGVQALAFKLPGRVQLSMNLFRLSETPPAAVEAELARRNVVLGSQQLVGLCPAAVAIPVAAGRLVEGRLAAAAAQAGARRCRDQGDLEHIALAMRLERESQELAQLGIGQDDLLAGAERAAALAPVLKAAGALDDELDGMISVAAGGLRDAISEQTRSRYGARMAALGQRLETTP